MKLIDMIGQVLREAKKPLHVDDIALGLCEKYPNISIELHNLPPKISATLSSDLKRKKSASLFAKVKNKQGGFKRGVYRVKSTRRQSFKKQVIPEQPMVKPAYTGHAGEHAVLSELLFFNFNPSIMTVDDGIDIVASKNNVYFHIQVKTANLSKSEKYNYSIQMKSFDAKNQSNTFYIFVMRVFDKEKYFNEYLVISNTEIQRWMDSGLIKVGEKISFRVSYDQNRNLMVNDIEDIGWCKNRFDLIR
ncbi:MAG: hypothetical protein AAGL17_25360 [Cyanobacteria bacterium J06576_12]